MAQLKISETQRTKGVILALLSTLSFSFMMIFAALNSPEIPLWEQTFFRNLIGIFVASFILIKNHPSHSSVSANTGRRCSRVRSSDCLPSCCCSTRPETRFRRMSAS